jgi:hypothetical protein
MRTRMKVFLAAAMAAASAAAWAQAGGAPAAQGFNAQTLVAELSIFLPEESTRAMVTGMGGRGGSGGSAQGAGQSAQGARSFPQMQFTRNPKLFLTADQVRKLLPIMTGLRDNPMPSPSKARQVQASVDAILTAEQKAEYADYRAQMQKMVDQLRQRMSAAAGGSGASGGMGGAQTGGQDQGQAQAGGRAGGQGGQQLTPLERRKRQLDAFVAVLQDRLKQLGG